MPQQDVSPKHNGILDPYVKKTALQKTARRHLKNEDYGNTNQDLLKKVTSLQHLPVISN